ncbi:MAG: IMPACT family protein [Eubacterium sp.]
MEPSYHILYKEGQGEVVEKKSRFIANIFPVNTEEEALERVGQIKKKHYDARHNCFAYVIGEKNEIMRCSDDGEPSGTAGRPMLEVLTGREIHNAVAIVTILAVVLGTGGCCGPMKAVQKGWALRGAACSTGFKLRIETDYNGIGKLQYLARTLELHELDIQYGELVQMTLLVPEDQIDAVEKDITEQTAGKAQMEREEKVAYGMSGKEIVFFGKKD